MLDSRMLENYSKYDDYYYLFLANKCISIGLEPITARFEVQILGEELFYLLRRIHRRYVAFYIPFYPPVGIEPRTPRLTAPRLLKIGLIFYK